MGMGDHRRMCNNSGIVAAELFPSLGPSTPGRSPDLGRIENRAGLHYSEDSPQLGAGPLVVCSWSVIRWYRN